MSILLKKDRIHYLYIGHLVLRVAPSAFSKLFDIHYNGGFKVALLKEEQKFEEIISQDQWQQLSKLAGQIISTTICKPLPSTIKET